MVPEVNGRRNYGNAGVTVVQLHINLESMITELPDVRNCAVVGVNAMEHSQGQYPVALVEFVDGAETHMVCRRIYDYCYANAEERGRPVAVVAVKKLMLTPMGKVDNRSLETAFREFDYLSWLKEHQ